MESGQPPDRPPGGRPDEPGPQGPQPPAPGPTPPAWPPPPAGYPPGSPVPPPPAGPYTAPGPEGPPGGYTGPVPPGGWQAPVAPVAWAGAPLAGWGPRAGATLLDGLVVFALAIVLVAPGVIVLVAGAEVLGVVLLILGGLGYIAGGLLYAPYFMQRQGAHNGQTLGKQWLGLRVVRDTGEPLNWGSALLREFVVKSLLFVGAGSFFVYIPTLLDWLWPLWDDQNRALHDMVVSTHVVKV